MTTRRKAMIWQAMAAAAVVALLLTMGHNALVNMDRRNISLNFSFLGTRAGFDIPFHLIAWDGADTYARALLVAGLNTLLAAVLSVGAATLLGLLLALMRLSGNPIAAGPARGIVEVVRNTPQLLQIIFFYLVVLQSLPGLRQSLSFRDIAWLNVRGLYLPAPTDGPWDLIAAATIFAVILAAVSWRRVGLMIPRLIVLSPLLVVGLVAAGMTAHWDIPSLSGFNFTGGLRIPPELLALCLGITVYTSAFIAEIIRAAILGVDRGQSEAARSLGLTGWRVMTLVVLPQALRILIPPLTSQYLNVMKSTTLGAAIAYPEILQIFGRTVLNQSGRAMEVMTLVLSVFLSFNLLTSWVMNSWNRRLALPGR